MPYCVRVCFFYNTYECVTLMPIINQCECATFHKLISFADWNHPHKQQTWLSWLAGTGFFFHSCFYIHLIFWCENKMCFTTLNAAMLHGTPVISKCWRFLPIQDLASLTNVRPQRTKNCDRKKRNNERKEREREKRTERAWKRGS